MSVVLFGCGSKMIVDYEETCARLGVEIAAIVKNFEGPDYALLANRIVAADQLEPALLACPYMVPFFTPAYRLGANADAAKRGFSIPATLVDPSATVSRSAVIGAGSYVNAGAVIGGAATIGGFVVVNRSASVGHHVEIADFASVGPGAILCGSVRLERGAVVAAGATLIENVRIGRNSVVAAGAVVRESVADHCLVAGNPAEVVNAAYAGYRNVSV